MMYGGMLCVPYNWLYHRWGNDICSKADHASMMFGLAPRQDAYACFGVRQCRGTSDEGVRARKRMRA